MSAEDLPAVFLSHSHANRDDALRIQKILTDNGAVVILDQEQFVAGDELPTAIHEGIAACDQVVILWSVYAAKSKWVNTEWQLAFKLQKRIIPYKIDGTPLPGALQNFIYVKEDDRQHGNAELFRAVFGQLPESPKGVDVFPGRWIAEIGIDDGSGNKGNYELDLLPNGQVTGYSQLEQTGMFGWVIGVAGQTGFDGSFMFQKTPLRGTWSYSPGDGLHLDLIISAIGGETPVSVHILTTHKRTDVLRGTGPMGTKWVLRRQS